MVCELGGLDLSPCSAGFPLLYKVKEFNSLTHKTFLSPIWIY